MNHRMIWPPPPKLSFSPSLRLGNFFKLAFALFRVIIGALRNWREGHEETTIGKYVQCGAERLLQRPVFPNMSRKYAPEAHTWAQRFGSAANNGFRNRLCLIVKQNLPKPFYARPLKQDAAATGPIQLGSLVLPKASVCAESTNGKSDAKSATKPVALQEEFLRVTVTAWRCGTKLVLRATERDDAAESVVVGATVSVGASSREPAKREASACEEEGIGGANRSQPPLGEGGSIVVVHEPEVREHANTSFIRIRPPRVAMDASRYRRGQSGSFVGRCFLRSLLSLAWWCRLICIVFSPGVLVQTKTHCAGSPGEGEPPAMVHALLLPNS